MKKKDLKGSRESEKKMKTGKEDWPFRKKRILEKAKQGNKRSPNSRELSWNTTPLTHWELHWKSTPCTWDYQSGTTNIRKKLVKLMNLKKKSFGHLQKKYMVYKGKKIIFSLDFPGATPYVKRK